MKLEGKVALVTGGGIGIGAGIAERFVKEGAKVCITGRRAALLDKVAQSLPSGTITTCSGDVSKDEDVARMVAATVEFGGKLDVLVNNAGIASQLPITDLSREEWQNVLDINLTGPFLLMKAALPHMIKAGGGSIINIASVGGVRCLANFPAYCTSKAGLIMLTQQAALDYGRYKIRCNAVCPGIVKTDITLQEFGGLGKMLGMEPDAWFGMITKALPLRRFAETAEMGGICTFLASEDSAFMTGAALTIDGGTAVVDVLGGIMHDALRRAGLED
jgi:meso-butanediol dehydrogenase / (S,S)-butanediol dehydrogenase / diacetyl reductase